MSEASFGYKESHIPAAKIAEMVLEASTLYHARTTQHHGKGRHIQSTTIIIGNNISKWISAWSDSTVSENPKEGSISGAFLLLSFTD